MFRKLMLCLLLILPFAFAGWTVMAQPHHRRPHHGGHCQRQCRDNGHACREGCRARPGGHHRHQRCQERCTHQEARCLEGCPGHR